MNHAVMIVVGLTYLATATCFMFLFGLLALAGTDRASKIVGIVGIILIMVLTGYLTGRLPA